jgi:hypothetical protein
VLQVPALRRVAASTAASLALLLAACGGGGGGGTDAPTASLSTGLFPASTALAGQCTVQGQKRWLRSYMHESYLWADEIPVVDAETHTTLPGYFDALLVRQPDASGKPRDRFSTTMTSQAADVMQNVGTAASAAALASSADPVPLVRTLASAGGRKVGYVLFNEHSSGAQDALITAFTSLRDAGVQDVVLDLRYNSGGFLYVAQSVAAMVAGPDVQGRVFESVRFNSRRTEGAAPEDFIFSTRVLTGETRYAKDFPLPQLSLPRLYVLTSTFTCSASESIVNGLRGIGVQVILVGDRTCGKPYGFYRKDNCGQAYFPIEFQVYNAAGFGDYQEGFPVQCQVAENPRSALGSATEPLLAAALGHIDTGHCPAAATPHTASVLQQSTGASMLDRPGAPPADSPMYQPGWNGRRLQP